MKRMRLVYLAILMCAQEFFGQTAPGKYWVQFTDKDNSPYSIQNPSAFLSEKSIARRSKYSLGFDARDLPVNQHYVDAVLALGNCTIHNKSKWFNAITISTTDTLVLAQISTLPFVFQVRSVHVIPGAPSLEVNKFEVMNERSSLALSNNHCEEYGAYGPSFRQIEMLNGHLLHALHYTGKGVDIAQFDGGWRFADSLPAFDHLRNDGRIKMTMDFVNGESVYTQATHGTFVLSTMAGIIADSLIGTAPDANYYLFKTEDTVSENLVEEDNWVAAAELCDSLGIDIINSSLGYSLFDQSENNHSYADMDGNTTRCSIAADIAAEKGILVVNSAGNSGNNPWHYITAPSDGDSVLCVGSVDSNEHHSAFSSYGPSSDGDVKPDVMAMGQSTVYADLDSTIKTGNGTSFSSPIMAGMAACLMQAFPNKSNMEIIHAIRESAHRFLTPSDSLGYGIPDLFKSFLLLGNQESHAKGDMEAILFPNPCNDYLNIVLFNQKNCDVEYEIYDSSGRRMYENHGLLTSENNAVLRIENTIGNLAQGNYTIHLGRAGEHSVLHFQVLRP